MKKEYDLIRLEVSASEVRMAFEAALRAMLSITLEVANRRPETPRSVPFRGEGSNLAELFQDLIADLEAQLEIHGRDAHDVTVDGVIANGDGGYVGWGYLLGAFAEEPGDGLPHLLDQPVVTEDSEGRVVIQATLAGR